MADLKVGSTVGGLPIWHYGTFPLAPAGNSLTYREKKVYTEIDKPQAIDNDFVSKASGGTGSNGFQKEVELRGGIRIPGGGTQLNGIYPGNGDSSSLNTANMDIVSWYGVGIKSSLSNGARTVVWNARTGDQLNAGTITVNGQVISNKPAPTEASHLTRKDYVDVKINTVTNIANAAVKRAGDTMTGALTAPFFISKRAATSANEVAILSQVIVKDTIIDFGGY